MGDWRTKPAANVDGGHVCRIVTYAVSERGLAETARIENPAIGRVGLDPMYGGFIQRGIRDLVARRRRSPTGP